MNTSIGKIPWLVITAKTCQGGNNFVQIEAGEKHQGLVKTLITSIAGLLEKNNFYRGKKLNFDSGIFFLTRGTEIGTLLSWIPL